MARSQYSYAKRQKELAKKKKKEDKRLRKVEKQQEEAQGTQDGLGASGADAPQAEGDGPAPTEPSEAGQEDS